MADPNNESDEFQSTLSMRRATTPTYRSANYGYDFNPRSP